MEMEKFSFQYSNTSYKTKPVGFDKTTQFWNYYTRVKANIEQMAAAITDGRCWRNGIYDPKYRSFKKQYVTGTRFVVLDFDQVNFEPQEMIDAAQKLGMQPNMWYYSFSQGIKEGNNFRMVWVLDSVINQAQFAATMDRFLDVFKDYNPDTNTKDISRMWYAGSMGVEIISKELNHWDDWEITPQLIKDGRVLNSKSQTLDRIVDNANITIASWQTDLDQYCPLWRKLKSGKYLNRMERMVLVGNLKHISGSFEPLLEQFLKFSAVYQVNDSNFSKNELVQWYNDKTLSPAPIMEDGRKKVTVVEWFQTRLF
jgi:hypothetical protein